MREQFAVLRLAVGGGDGLGAGSRDLPYRTARPSGSVAVITPDRWSGWSAT
jgi:hypothetical protein